MIKNDVRTDFDRLARAATGVRWDHNNHYHPLILSRLPASRGHALEIGCGSGALLGLLAPRFELVTGIDFSYGMIARARECLAGAANIRLPAADADEFDFGTAAFDLIVSVAALHHLDAPIIIPRLARALAPGGRLIVLDLLRPTTPFDWLASGLAAAVNLVAERLRNRERPLAAEERAVWRDHTPRDRYASLGEIRRLASSFLPGVRVKRLLYWRYLLVWEKPAGAASG